MKLLWTLPVLAAVAGAGDSLALAVPEGTVLQKAFKLEHDLVVQDVAMEGADVGLLSQTQIDLKSSVELEVSDHYLKMDRARPLEIQRLYRKGGFHVDIAKTGARGEKVPEVWDADTPLRGKSVVFTWVPEEKSYSRYYDQAETLEEYLANLTQDLDLQALLPGREVQAGESWTIDPARLVDLFVPGGNIPLGFVKRGESGLGTAFAAGVGAPLHPVFGGTTKGNCRALWKETREQEGARLAVIELAITMETSRDRTEAARKLIGQDEDEQGASVRHAGVEWKFSGSGTLLWNLGAGRFEKLDLAGREDVMSDIEFAFGGDDARQRLSMAGSLTVTATATAKTGTKK